MQNDLTKAEVVKKFYNTSSEYWRSGKPTARLLITDQMRKKRSITAPRGFRRFEDGIQGQLQTGLDKDWGIHLSRASMQATINFLEYLKIIEVMRDGVYSGRGRSTATELVFHPEELVEEDLRALEELDNWQREERTMTALEAVGSSLTLEEIERRYVGDSFESNQTPPDPANFTQEALKSSPSTFPADEAFSVADAILARVAEVLSRGEPEPQIQYIENPHDMELGKKLYQETELYNKSRARCNELEDLLMREREVVQKLNSRIHILNSNIEVMKKQSNNGAREEFEKMVQGFMTKREGKGGEE